MSRTYLALSLLTTFSERYQYLRLGGRIGEETFGFDRYFNQLLYQSKGWRRLRDEIIVRDRGCDMGLEGFEIFGRIVIHHLNPITLDDVTLRRECVFDPENLISVSHATHNAIHYGDQSLLACAPIERTKGDTCPWRH